MLSADLLLTVCIGYVALLFGIAFFVDRQSRRGGAAWLRSPIVYTLSLSVYCTSWTFYGAVGSAARNGLEFITIYLGPTIVFIGWWWLLRKLVRIGKAHKVTSIADLISSRYGKSASLGVLVTIIALIATTPYIALQLQSLTRSTQIIVGNIDPSSTAFIIASGLAVFTILFGTRNLDANERHHGVVAAIAVEAVVKLIALLAVGIFVVFSVLGGVETVFKDVGFEAVYGEGELFDSRWVALTLLSATAIICLPRQFQVTVVENVDEKHLATASWLFPLYLLGMCLFVVPIAIAGTTLMPEGANPDLYVLTLPLSLDRQDLTLLAFLGGFSSATSMVIVAAIAVSTMISNHIVMPIALQISDKKPIHGDVRKLLLNTRRVSIGAVLGFGFLYFEFSGGSDALAAIGLIAFAGVAQFMPSLVGGIFWKNATRKGAISGLILGFLLWGYTLFLPSFNGAFLLSHEVLNNGLLGYEFLRPHSLFGLSELDPLVHALVWSLGTNTLLFVVISCFTSSTPIEHLQGALFVDVFKKTTREPIAYNSGDATAEDLYALAQKILGSESARRLFDGFPNYQGDNNVDPYPSALLISQLERELAGSVGAASAHAMIQRITGKQSISMIELMDIADETQQLIKTYQQLSEKSDELTQTMSQLREANIRLRDLDVQKDDFLSQVSHELRTPMTSIRSLSEILLNPYEISKQEQEKFVAIIHEESQRLTRLLDEILHIHHLEEGSLDLRMESLDLNTLIHSATDSLSGEFRQKGVSVTCEESEFDTCVLANPDRLRQVLINILSNAIKHNRSNIPAIEIRLVSNNQHIYVEIEDNGSGVNAQEAALVFEKFRRGQGSESNIGTGLGLPISRANMRNMNGDLTIEFNQDNSSFFRLKIPKSEFQLTRRPTS